MVSKQGKEPFISPPKNRADWEARARTLLYSSSLPTFDALDLGQWDIIDVTLRAQADGGSEEARVLYKYFLDHIRNEDEEVRESAADEAKLDALMPNSLEEFSRRVNAMAGAESHVARATEYPLESASVLMPFLEAHARTGDDGVKALLRYYLKVLKNPEFKRMPPIDRR